MSVLEGTSVEKSYVIPTKYEIDWEIIDVFHIFDNLGANKCEKIKLPVIKGCAKTNFTICIYLKKNQNGLPVFHFGMECSAPIIVKGGIFFKTEHFFSYTFKEKKKQEKEINHVFELSSTDRNVNLRIEFLAHPAVNQYSKVLKSKNSMQHIKDFRTFGQHLQDQQDNSKLTDFVISSNGENFHCHKAVLVARSAKFRKLLENVPDVPSTFICMDEYNNLAVKGLLGYIYNGDPFQVFKKEFRLIREVLELGQKFQVTGMKYFSDLKKMTFCSKSHQLDFDFHIAVKQLTCPKTIQDIKSQEFYFCKHHFCLKINFKKSEKAEQKKQKVTSSKQSTFGETSNSDNNISNQTSEIKTDDKIILSLNNLYSTKFYDDLKIKISIFNSEDELIKEVNTEILESNTESLESNTEISKSKKRKSLSFLLYDGEELHGLLNSAECRSSQKSNSIKLKLSLKHKYCVKEISSKIETFTSSRYLYDIIHLKSYFIDLNKLKNNLDMKKYFDTEILINTSQSIIPAHKVILSASSPNLRTLILKGEQIVLDVNEKVYNSIDDIISFLYCDEIDFGKIDVLEVYKFCYKYEFMQLFNKLRKHISGHWLSMSNANEALKAADYCHDELLKSSIKQHIKTLRNVVEDRSKSDDTESSDNKETNSEVNISESSDKETNSEVNDGNDQSDLSEKESSSDDDEEMDTD